MQELAELGVGEVDLIGGEAYLRADVLLVVRAIREAGMKAAIVTGGLNLTRARADALARAGLEQVSVSIDGLEASHDRLRGIAGGWRRALAALGHARAAGLTITANTQINGVSRHDLLPLGERLAAEGIASWQLFLTMAHGNAADDPDLLLQPFELLALFDTLETLVDRAAANGVVIWPGNNLGYFGPLEHALRRSQTRSGHYGGCQAGLTGIGIESNGGIKGCPSLGGASNVGGNWREHGLRALWERAEAIRYVERRSVDDLWGWCRTCYYAATCMAGCTATSEPLLGRPGNNPYCHHRVLELARVGLRERVEQVARPDRGPFAHGLFRVVREAMDPEARSTQPVAIEAPRTSRAIEMSGAGRPLSAHELGVVAAEVEGERS